MRLSNPDRRRSLLMALLALGVLVAIVILRANHTHPTGAVVLPAVAPAPTDRAYSPAMTPRPTFHRPSKTDRNG
jgi:hypothetical protein